MVPTAGSLKPSQRSLLWFGLMLAGLWLPALIDRGAVGAVADLHELAKSPNPYFIPSHAWLLYFRAPLAGISAWVLCLTPGLLLAPLLCRGLGVNRWLLYGFSLSLVVISPIVAAIQIFTGSSVRDWTFLLLLIVLSLISFGVTYTGISAGRPFAWPKSKPESMVQGLFLLVGAWVLSALLTPKVYWEVFNGDGAETYETARRLLHHALPFWPQQAGELSQFPSLTSMLAHYPASWFIRIFGEYEASVRLPVVFFGILTVAGVTRLAQHSRGAPIGLPERFLVRLVVAITIVVLGYHATYDPYVADLASPALHDFVLIVCFLGFVNAFLVGRTGWVCLWLCLSYLSWPNAVLLIVLWLIGAALLWRPRPWKTIAVSAATLTSCLAASAILPALLNAVNVAGPGGVNTFASLWQRATPLSQSLSFKYLVDSEHLRRLAYLIVPSGIVPAFSLVFWSKLDKVGRTVAFVTIAYFGFFYIQRTAVLHHFAPIMVLPLIVFWRADLELRQRHRKAFLGTAAIFAFLSLLLSFPHSLPVVTKARDFGSTVTSHLEGYDDSDPTVFARSEILRHAIPLSWDNHWPTHTYGGSPLAWNYYAHQSKKPDAACYYVLQPDSRPPPDGMTLLADEAGTALYVSDLDQLERDRASPPPVLDGSPLFSLRWETLLQWWTPQ